MSMSDEMRESLAMILFVGPNDGEASEVVVRDDDDDNDDDDDDVDASSLLLVGESEGEEATATAMGGFPKNRASCTSVGSSSPGIVSSLGGLILLTRLWTVRRRFWARGKGEDWVGVWGNIWAV